MYHGDIAEDATIRFGFNTNDADGAPITLAGTPAISVYKDGSTTQTTAGVTLNVDFDSLTGYHLVTIDTSADAFYATGSNYRAVITTGTVDGTSVVGSVVGHFSIQNRVVARVTGGVTLADDAITASKFDESTAFPMTAAYTAPLSAAGTRTAVGLASANLDTQLADLPTVAEFEARTLAAAAYFDPAADKVTPIDVDGITFASAMEVILAVLAGEATKNGSTYSYKKRDGTTAKITITVGSEKGVRTDSTIV